MGVIPNMDDAYEEVEVGTFEEGSYEQLPAGEYTGVIEEASIKTDRPGKPPWRDAELVVKIKVISDNAKGKITFGDFEVAPLTQKDTDTGAQIPSKGKLKFLKWQLEAMGYEGKLSDLEFSVNSLVGAECEFTQKEEPQADGRVNPKTNKPYTNREVVLKTNLKPGIAAPVAASAATGQSVVY